MSIMVAEGVMARGCGERRLENPSVMWYDDRKEERAELTSAHDKLSVGAKRISDLVCEISLSCLIVRRYSSAEKTGPERQ